MPPVQLTDDSTPETVLKHLQENGDAKQAERVRARGIPESSIFGTPKSIVQKTARTLGRNQELAESLWASNIHEARLVAILTAEPDKISLPVLKQWANDLWSWDIADHLARYLLPYIPKPELLIAYCATIDSTYTKRLAFAGIACSIQKNKRLSEEQFDFYRNHIQLGASDNRPHVRKAVVWALVEIGKINDSWQESAIVFAAELIEQRGNEAWVGRNAMKDLQLLVSVPERRRLISQKSKTGRKNG